jgi:hypothetical protein
MELVMAAAINTPMGNTDQAINTQAARSERSWLVNLVLSPFKDVDQRATEEFLNRYKRGR